MSACSTLLLDGCYIWKTNVLTAVVLSISLSIFLLQVDKILKVIPRDRKTFLFSATMTKQVRGEYFPLIILSSGCTVN